VTKTIKEPVRIEEVKDSDSWSNVDVFICCASFEKRSHYFVKTLPSNFKTRVSVIFVIEEQGYEKQTQDSLGIIEGILEERTMEKVYTIFCLRDSPSDGILQFIQIVNDCKIQMDHAIIALDISSFTKVYLLDLLHSLYFAYEVRNIHIIYTLQKYRCVPLTEGVKEIRVPFNFSAPLSSRKGILFIPFLGFDPERTLAVWEHYYPPRTIAIKSFSSSKPKYLEYVEKLNEHFLSRPSVDSRRFPSPYGIYATRDLLEDIYHEGCKESTSQRTPFNIVVAPFGPKVQVLGIFLFWLNHREVRVAYSFPITYRPTYLKRKPERTLYYELKLL